MKRPSSRRLFVFPVLLALLLQTGCATLKQRKASRQAEDIQQEYDELDGQRGGGRAGPQGTVEVDDDHNIRITTTAMFETGQSSLLPGARAHLAPLAANMQEHPENEAAVIGHADSRGSLAMNQQLSEQRAETVSTYLREQGVTTERLVTVAGRGEEQPVADNATAEGRAQNRRVEILIIPPARL